MVKNTEKHANLHYLYNTPKIVYWKVVAGNRELSTYERYDLIFDDYDYKIRKITRVKEKEEEERKDI